MFYEKYYVDSRINKYVSIILLGIIEAMNN